MLERTNIKNNRKRFQTFITSERKQKKHFKSVNPGTNNNSNNDPITSGNVILLPEAATSQLKDRYLMKKSKVIANTCKAIN
jgi:hypothetical protein